MKSWERLRFGVICLVTFVWAVNFFAAAVHTTYVADPAINTVFMTIVGSLFVGGELIKKWSATSNPPPEIEPKKEQLPDEEPQP